MRTHKSGIVFLIMFVGCCLFAQGIWNMSDAEINGIFTFNQPQIFNKAATFNGAVSYGSSSSLTLGGGTLTGKAGNTIEVGVTDGTITLGRDDAGTVTLTSEDSDANAALTVCAGGTGALTLGDTGSTAAISSSDWTIDATGAISNCTLTRDQLVQEDLASYPIPIYDLRHSAAPVGDAICITATSGNHILTYSAGVFGATSNAPSSSTVTDASVLLIPLPPEYVAGQTVTIRVNGLITAEPDPVTAAGKSLDINCYEITKTSGAKGADICATAAQTLTVTAAAYDFTITPTTLAAGDLLSVIITTVFEDDDGSEGLAQINGVELLIDIKG
jgi:hypothetical protein